jgi:cyclophilin family peptidyl-prolyl cis-trans isomerase
MKKNVTALVQHSVYSCHNLGRFFRITALSSIAIRPVLLIPPPCTSKKSAPTYEHNIRNVVLIIFLLLASLGLPACSSSTTPSTAGQQQPATGQNQKQESIEVNDIVQRNNKYSAPPPMTINTAKQYFAVVNTSLGTFKIKLLPQDAPTTVNNFVFLSREGYFNGIVFHRIIKDFMIQTGDPLGNGTGGPGYKFKDELPNKIPYAPGVVAMANAGANTNGSQFFICNGEKAALLNNNPNYTIFGQVVEGMDVVLNISNVPVKDNGMGELSKPVNSVAIKDISIEEN